MKWTKEYPQEPMTIWWIRVKYGDGSASRPTVALVKEHERYGIFYRFIGELESWTREEMEDDCRKNDYDVEFLGPITPPEDWR